MTTKSGLAVNGYSKQEYYELCRRKSTDLLYEIFMYKFH